MPTIALSDRYTRDAFLALDRSGRSKVRNAVKDGIADSVREGRFEDAASLQSYLDDVCAVAEPSEKVEIDPAVTIATRVAILRLAADLLADGDFVPEGMDSVDSDAIQAVSAETIGDVADAAIRVAKSKITRSPKMHDVPALIGSVLGDDPMTVSELSAAITAEYGTSPSTGAIGAAITRSDDGSHDEYGFVPAVRNGKVAAVRA